MHAILNIPTQITATKKEDASDISLKVNECYSNTLNECYAAMDTQIESANGISLKANECYSTNVIAMEQNECYAATTAVISLWKPMSAMVL